MTKLRCRSGCGEYFDKKLRGCPKCGTERWPTNPHLIDARWVSNLNAQAAHAVKHG